MARAGSPYSNSQDVHLVRNIRSIGLILADLMDNFHPENILQSVSVERLVRSLIVYKKSLSIEKINRG